MKSQLGSVGILFFPKLSLVWIFNEPLVFRVKSRHDSTIAIGHCGSHIVTSLSMGYTG